MSENKLTDKKEKRKKKWNLLREQLDYFPVCKQWLSFSIQTVHQNTIMQNIHQNQGAIMW